MLFALYKINFFITLFKKNLHISKKSSIFATDLKTKKNHKIMINEIFLVLRIGEKGTVIGTIRAFTTASAARVKCNELNDISYKLYKKCSYIVERVDVNEE